MAHFPTLRPLCTDMQRKQGDRDHFRATYGKAVFDVVVCLDSEPWEMLIGTEYNQTKWATILSISSEYENSMPNADFYALRDLIGMECEKYSEAFGSYNFLRRITSQAPTQYSGKLVSPHSMDCATGQGSADPNEKTQFCGWTHQPKGIHARNFEKTEKYFGKKIADYCRKHNISSNWTVPSEAGEQKPCDVYFPWEDRS